MLKAAVRTACAGLVLGASVNATGSVRFLDAEVVAMANYSAAGGDIMAFVTNERSSNADLDGDGMLNDSVLTFTRISNGQVTNTGIPVYSFRIETDGEHIVFLQRESYAQEDFTGDGDRQDIVLAWYNVNTGQVTYSDIVPHINTGSLGSLRSYSIDGDIIAYIAREFRIGADVTGDGDTNDYVVRYVNIATGMIYDTGLSTTYAQVSEGLIATNASEAATGLDLDGDGDTDNNVIVVFDTETAAVTSLFALPAYSLSSPTSFPVIDGQRLAYRVHESVLGEDMDQDGSLWTQNLVFGVDLQSGEHQYLGFSGGKQLSLDGDLMAYYTSEHDIDIDVNGDGNTHQDFLTAVRHLPSGAVTYFDEVSEYNVTPSGLLARQSENRFGADANADGDMSDMLAWFAAVDTPAEPQPPAACEDIDIVCRLLRLNALIAEQDIDTALSSQFTDMVDLAIAAYADDSVSLEQRVAATLAILDEFASFWSMHYALDLPMEEGDRIFDEAKPIYTLLEEAYLYGVDILLPTDDQPDDPNDDPPSSDGPSGEEILAALFEAIAQPGVSDTAAASIAAQLNDLMSVGMNPDLSDEEKAAIAEPMVVQLVADIDGFVASGDVSSDAAGDIVAGVQALVAFLQQWLGGS